MLKQRIITALILASVALLALFAESNLYWTLLINIAVSIGLWEWLRLCQVTDITRKIVAYVGFLVLLLILQLGYVPLSIVIPFGCLLWLGLILFTVTDALNFLHQRDIKLVIGMLVLAVSGLLVIELKALNHGSLWILCFMVSVFAADIGAYFVGRRFGKTKLAPTISPGKTVEGLLGGLAFAMLLYLPLLFLNFPFSQAALLLLTVLVTVLVSVVGDLFMSKMKRYADIKDSSQILPGHGGILDRIDSLLSAAPFFAFGLLLLGYF